jgi:hypothetical protein
MADAINAEKKSFHWRGHTSLVVTLAFLVLATTGVILYVSPQGRVANWTGWNVWGLSKEEWAAAHTTAALLFLVASGFHVYFNWSTLVRYIVRQRKIALKREMIGAAAVVAAVFVGTVVGIPPLSGIADLNDRIKAHWEGRSEQAPYPHAEASTLADFSEKTGIPPATLVERLARAGISVDDPASQTLEDLARARGLSPNELFAAISRERESGAAGHGMGTGRLTIQELCEQRGIDPARALEVLREEGYSADAAMTLKSLAEQKGVTPWEIRELIVKRAQ